MADEARDFIIVSYRCPHCGHTINILTLIRGDNTTENCEPFPEVCPDCLIPVADWLAKDKYVEGHGE